LNFVRSLGLLRLIPVLVLACHICRCVEIYERYEKNCKTLDSVSESIKYRGTDNPSVKIRQTAPECRYDIPYRYSVFRERSSEVWSLEEAS
jgi:hypothetical protein